MRAAASGTPTKSRAVDAMWDDITPLRHVSRAERTGYPTQKPEKLLARIVDATSDPGDAVLDPFGGSGTTALVAARLGRRFVTIDASAGAIDVTRVRLQSASVPFTDERVVTEPAKKRRA